MEYELKDLQAAVLYIAKEIKRICDANNIKYTMIGGTLIGSLRHQGFIPWDDDIDFVMARNEYNRFLVCCKKQLSDEFELMDWHEDAYWPNGMAKILLKGTVAIPNNRENAKYKRMIFVDIIPFDKIPDSKFLQLKQRAIISFCRKFIFLHSDDTIYNRFTGGKRILHKLLMIPTKYMNRNRLVEICEKELSRYSSDNTKNYTSIIGSYGYNKEIVPVSIFENYIELPFEDTTFMAIKEYDLYLKQVFGNYMEMPPVEKRINHGMLKLDFGDFFDRHKDVRNSIK